MQSSIFNTQALSYILAAQRGAKRNTVFLKYDGGTDVELDWTELKMAELSWIWLTCVAVS
jgi:hypothetical protein